MRIITYNDFTDEEKFNEIKKDFLIYDMKYNHLRDGPDDIKLDLIEDNIGLFGSEGQEKTINFYDGFLLPKISDLGSIYKRDFCNYIESNKIYDSSAIANFSKLYLKRLDKWDVEIKGAKYLNPQVKEALKESIAGVYGFVSNDFHQKYINLPKKIPLKLSKNQIITLFYLLKNNKYISTKEISDNDLSRLIEQHFLYYNSMENCYKEITDARKLELKLFGPNEELSPQISLDELEIIFTAEDFYTNIY